jgi:uncharacterized heparinase superfamily protein
MNAASDEWRATPFYRMMLGGTDPAAISYWPREVRIGSEARGRDLLAGEWRIAAERLGERRLIPFDAPAPSRHFTARLHSFSWLGDLAACGPAATESIGALIGAWVQDYGGWHAAAWAPELTAQRLQAWLYHGEAAFLTAPDEERARWLRSLGRQARHLQLAAGDITDPPARVKAGAALALAGLAGLPEGERLLDLGLEILMECSASQFYADGGHLSRSPEILAEAHYDYAGVRLAVKAQGGEFPRLLGDTLQRTADMLRLLRLGDGRLGCFHGGGEGDAASLEAALSRLPVGRSFRFAAQSGYQRLDAGRASLLLDAGPSPAPAHAERAHSGALSFEFTDGPDRIFVNVGSGLELHPDWRAAGRATNAHSTLIVDEELSAKLEPSRISRGGARPAGPPGLTARRFEDDEGAWIETSHEGYRAQFGFVHRRTIFIDVAGKDLRGQDVLARPSADGKPSRTTRIPFAIRFHLHPTAAIERAPSGALAIRTRTGELWKLRTDAETVEVENSIYLGDARGPLKSRQIVLKGLADPAGLGDAAPNRVRWAFTRFERS